MMGEVYVCREEDISVPSAKFCCEPKTALKNKIYLKGKIESQYPKLISKLFETKK